MISTLASRYVPIMKSYNFPVLQNAAAPRALSLPSCALSVLTHRLQSSQSDRACCSHGGCVRFTRDVRWRPENLLNLYIPSAGTVLRSTACQALSPPSPKESSIRRSAKTNPLPKEKFVRLNHMSGSTPDKKNAKAKK